MFRRNLSSKDGLKFEFLLTNMHNTCVFESIFAPAFSHKHIFMKPLMVFVLAFLFISGNLVARPTLPPPTITSFSPMTASPGAIITITGTNFTDATDVSFNGASALTFTVVSATTITAQLGDGNAGAITVTTPLGSATSGTSLVLVPTIINNLAEPIDANSTSIANTNWTAQSFINDGIQRSLVSISLVIPNGDAAAEITIHNATGGNDIGAPLSTFAAPTYISGSIYRFVPNSPVTLNANTRYWIVLKSSDASGGTDFSYTLTMNNTGTGTIPATKTWANCDPDLCQYGADGPYYLAVYAAIFGTVPVNWLSFTGQYQKDRTVLLQWRTASESQSLEYVVQHSTNNGNWNDIGTLAAAGQTATVSDYTFLHRQPASGVNYYRLLQRDRNGRIFYSKVVPVIVDENKSGLRILNNPVTNGVLYLQTTEKMQVQLFTSMGQLVKKQQLNAGSQQMDLGHLPAGTYFLRSEKINLKVVIR